MRTADGLSRRRAEEHGDSAAHGHDRQMGPDARRTRNPSAAIATSIAMPPAVTWSTAFTCSIAGSLTLPRVPRLSPDLHEGRAANERLFLVLRKRPRLAVDDHCLTEPTRDKPLLRS